jgi:hypothetical protein
MPGKSDRPTREQLDSAQRREQQSHQATADRIQSDAAASDTGKLPPPKEKEE